MALATCAFNFAALNTSTEVVEEQVQREPVSIPHGTWMVKEQRLADHQVDMLMWETDEGSGRCLPRMSRRLLVCILSFPFPVLCRNL
jgi:hypothetical protein